MKLCRFNQNRIGVVRNALVYDVTLALQDLPALRYPFPFGDQFVANLDTLRPKMEALADSVAGTPIDQVRLFSPVANPSKIIGTPANYYAHVAEAHRDPENFSAGRNKTVREQGLFLKATSSLVGTGEGVAVRFPDRRTDHEIELGVIIGRKTGFVSPENALSVVAGYAIALDMVMRGKEDRSLRKSLESYAVLGPWMVTADEIPDPGALSFALRLNGELRQSANTRDMIVNVREQISWASSLYTLYPGDIIMSGTCDGVGPVKAGDVMNLSFEVIGQANVSVRAAE
jgi:2-keto-4-pentenoate hydratase/2-oxohepta-3-ene-1,7-dioic acid hydratase in catechol pathway